MKKEKAVPELGTSIYIYGAYCLGKGTTIENAIGTALMGSQHGVLNRMVTNKQVVGYLQDLQFNR